MQVSDYIASFLYKKKIRHIYAVGGGAALHLINSAKKKKLKVIFPIHEQTCAMAADAHSRISNNLGAAFATSGPGATNLATGICGAYFDSIPVIYITGQVSTNRSKNKLKVRQIGFQETDCVSMYKSVTKYVYKIKHPSEIKYQLEKAYQIAVSGRKGPVLIDIPDDIQRALIKPEKLKSYNKKPKNNIFNNISKKKIDLVVKFLENSKRPILILGWGVHMSQSYDEIRKLIKKLKIPVVLTWAMAHILPQNEKLRVGTWGTHGTRYGNFAVQNADLVLSIGSRLDTKATGSPINTFAREARKIVIDIDNNELNKFSKFGLNIDLKINSDCKNFAKALLKKKILINSEINNWFITIEKWKKNYPICPDSYYESKSVNPYVLVKTLSKLLKNDSIICLDTGCAIAWMMQAFEFKRNQILIHDFNNTAMGWSIPASIASAIYLKKEIVVIIGDGSLSFMIQELSLIKKLNLKIKILLLNNKGHGMIRQTQDQWLKSNYYGSSIKGGLADIDYLKVSNSFGLSTFRINSQNNLEFKIKKFLNNQTPSLCEINIPYNAKVIPQVKFGRPNEDLEPLISRKEFKKNMIVKII
jgi:acetolactate synthase-1/2/3 large subunit